MCFLHCAHWILYGLASATFLTVIGLLQDHLPFRWNVPSDSTSRQFCLPPLARFWITITVMFESSIGIPPIFQHKNGCLIAKVGDLWPGFGVNPPFAHGASGTTTFIEWNWYKRNDFWDVVFSRDLQEFHGQGDKGCVHKC